MATVSLFAALLRRSRPRNCAVPTLSTSRCESYRLLSSAFSSSRSEGFAVEEEPAEPEDDLRSRIFRLRLPKRSAKAALDRWVSEGRTVTAAELRQIANDLRRSQRYKHALETSEWMKIHRECELLDSDYAMRIDLIAKVFGISSAEDFFGRLPSSAKSCEAYTALLHAFAAAKMTENAEDLFQRFKESNLPSNALIYNEMMTLYISVGQLNKVPPIVEELKRRKVSPDLFTYNLWVSSCAATLNIDAVRMILNEMAQEPNSNEGWITYMRLTDIYLNASRLVGSESAIAEADTKISQSQWITYDFLIILHASLGHRKLLNDIWKSLRKTAKELTSRKYICIISSYLVLDQLKEAGEIIDEWRQSKTQEFDISDCNRIFEALKEAGLADTADKFQDLMLQKDCKLTSTF